MKKSLLGKTNMEITRIGLGLAEVFRQQTKISDQESSHFLNSVLDQGINFLDTAPCYGITEKIIGRTVANRRNEYYLATKAGHVTGGYSGIEWTGKTITDSIDRSLKDLSTDYLDLVQLHSCEIDILENSDCIESLIKAQEAGKTRFIGYSGDNDAAAWAINSGIFATLQTSFNIVDQNARLNLFEKAQSQNMGIIIKRPVANGAWQAKSLPSQYATQYFERAKIMDSIGPIDSAYENPIDLTLAFVLSHKAVTTAIVGTHNLDHLKSNIELSNSDFDLNNETLQEIYSRFKEHKNDWVQLM